MRWGKADASDEEIWEALEIAQAKEVAEKKGQGLEFMIDQGRPKSVRRPEAASDHCQGSGAQAADPDPG